MNLAYFILQSPAVTERACAAIRELPLGTVLIAKEPTRTLEQNSRMWCLLHDVAKQIQWQVDGELRWLDEEEWKAIFTAALRQELRVARGINGGSVLLPQRTSKMSKREHSDLMTLIEAFGSERGVVWSEPDVVEK